MDKESSTSNTTTTNNEEDRSKLWEDIRKQWLKKPEGVKKSFAKSQEVRDKDRYKIQEIIRSTKPPYIEFKHNINLEEMVDILVEVWEDDDDF